MDTAKREELLKTMASKLNQAMRTYLEVCSRCGTCIDKCHTYASHPAPQNSAVFRAETVRKLFRKYFHAEGKLAPLFGELNELSDEALESLYDAAYSCTGCRRCMLYCPFGVDTQMIMSIAKLMLIKSDREPKSLTMLADMSVMKGKTIEKTKVNFTAAVRNLEKEVIEKWKSDAGTKEVIPLDVQNADVLYVALAGKHSIIPAAAILNAAKANWTLSYFEAVNFGAFVGDPQKTREIADRIINEAKRLNVKEVAICECGTAYRVMRHLMGELPFKTVSFIELIARYLKEGRIHVTKNKVPGRFSYHDPCQLARNGGVYEAPREILKALTDDFVELTPTRAENWCCGGGGGLVIFRDKEYRMKSAKVKADQIRQAAPAVLATACENCHTQLKDLSDHYKLGAQVAFLSSLVADALER